MAIKTTVKEIDVLIYTDKGNYKFTVKKEVDKNKIMNLIKEIQKEKE